MIKINYNELKAARTAPVWCSVTAEAQSAALAQAIRHIHTIRGIAYNQEHLITSCQELTQFIDRRYPGMTLGEIQLALEYGVRGDLGNRDTYINIAAMQSWIAAFYESSERVEAIDEMEPKKHKALPAPDTEALNAQFFRDQPRAMFEAYRAGDTTMGIHLDVIAALVYDYLERQGLFSGMTDRTRAEAREEAERQLPPTDRWTSAISSVRESCITDRMKRVLLARYFQALIAVGRDLNYEAA